MQLKWPMLWDLFSLFPAYAGVILVKVDECIVHYPFPRIRGGDPYRNLYAGAGSTLFPAYAGVIPAATINDLREALFPAYAGVILKAAVRPVKPATFPRIRGGDPMQLL